MPGTRVSAPIFGLMVAVALAVSPGGAPASEAPDLEAQIAGIVAHWEVPGLSVTVVHRGEVVLAAGFGIRQIHRPEPVSSTTLFSIGSCTKAFTAAAVGTLVEQERLRWDDPVVEHLNHFAMPDPAETARVTLRDLLANRTGLAGGDLISWGSTFKRLEIVERLRYLDQVAPLRSNFKYNNNAYVAAGEVAAAAAGTSWDQLVESRILGPLGMERTVTSITSFPPAADRATPHAVVNGELLVVPAMNEDNCAAAGSIWSSATDMNRWVRMLLSQGVWAKGTLLRPETIAEMFKVHTPIPIDESDSDLPVVARPTFEGYGLGWNVHDYRGHTVVSHGGQSDGMVAQVTLVPEQGLGIVILLNLHNSDAYKPVEYLLLDAFLEVDQPIDWGSVFLPPEADAPGASAPDTSTTPTEAVSLDPFAGRYNNPVVGAATIVLDEGQLRLGLERTPLYGGLLEHLENHTYLVHREYPLVESSPVEFHTDPRGRVEGFTLRPDPTEWLASRPYRYDRISDEGEIQGE